ncbi:MAG: cobalamin biosynthesis protein CobD [Proteobacteria bacterium]|nr:cobalamin biosynthesis protein CobD [Pseudomonadota bacterium]
MVSDAVNFAANPSIIAAALLLEAAFGYPDALYRAIRHPVVWCGALIAWLDQRLNRREAQHLGGGRMAGVAALAVVLAAAGLPAWGIQAGLMAALPRWAAIPALGVLASPLLAQRSLFSHVRAVETGLRAGLEEGRAAVSHIVGRNPQSLDAAGVARAAIESLAENFSDGVVAPALWGALLGLPGIALYKAVNTADSMIGHRTPRHAAFGWAAARFDDLVNLPASRLSAMLVLGAAAICGGDVRGAWGAVWRDARHHRSPNAGWPEAAVAGALGLRLAGPRVYGSARVDDAWMGDGRAEATADDIARALRLYRAACGIGIACVALAAVALSPR